MATSANLMTLARIKARSGAIIALFMLAGTCVAHAGDPPPIADDVGPGALVEQTSARLLEALRSRRDQFQADPGRVLALVDEIVATRIDFARMAQWVLGKHWETATEVQRQRFVTEFRTLLLRTYATAVNEYPEVEIVYLPVKTSPSGNEALVRTQVPQVSGKPIDINYRLHKHDGPWLVYDVSIEGVSLVKTYRSSFSSEMRKLGLDGLIDQLAEQNHKKTVSDGGS